jgi:putative Holliday junction resolvase
MTIAAVDFGKKRIGLAVSDASGIGAYPLCTIERRSNRLDFAAIQRQLAGREVARVVIGLPLSMDGSEGTTALAARQFGIQLGKYLGLPIDFQDERLSSIEADERLASASVRRGRRKAARDSMAAAVILEGWLEAHSQKSNTDSSA